MTPYILEVTMKDGKAYILGVRAESREAAIAAVRLTYKDTVEVSAWVPYGFHSGVVLLTETPRLLCYR